jgi:hypothetical protein
MGGQGCGGGVGCPPAESLPPQSIQRSNSILPQSVMRVKLGQAVEGGGCTPNPFHYIYHTFTITNKVAVYAPAEWADT